MNYNLSNPDIQTLENNAEIIVPGYQDNYVFTSTACALFGDTYCNGAYSNLVYYNNLTTAGSYNETFPLPNDGYLILTIQSVSEEYNPNIQPEVGTFGVDSYSASILNYTLSGELYPIKYCQSDNAYETVSECSSDKPITDGFTEYPSNLSATYLMPVSRGNEKLTFSNYNEYPITIQYTLTYVGFRYSNLTQISANYSTK